MPAGQELHRLVDLHVGRQHQDADVRELPSDRHGGLEALGVVTGGHADVDDDEVGLLLADQANQLLRVTASTRDLEPGAHQQPGDSFTEQDVVVGHHDPRGCGRFALFTDGERCCPRLGIHRRYTIPPDARLAHPQRGQ